MASNHLEILINDIPILPNYILGLERVTRVKIRVQDRILGINFHTRPFILIVSMGMSYVILLAKIRHHINKDALKTIYHAIFSSHMSYAAQIWGLSSKNISNSIQKLQNKALRIINFKKYYDECEILFRQCKILKFEDTIFYNNCLFVSNCLAKTTPEAFNNTYKLTQDNHTYSTRGSRNKLIDVPKVNTHYYGTNSFKLTSLRQWNSLQNTLNFDLTEHHRKKTQFKKNLKSYLINK